ncbi:MAG: hypothetical protein A2087_00190 [Spirochaetes bacterium GWD1_61_31]|nr:MAG: hypothetical protein A2087_00190 [Spirochaetes bacterium GWD1_61_31]HAP43973.1 hypothetical protein [Spirochaetaceae bacterium]HAW85001.1 hypothetical protein [Spirochaetaceae bacterium]
MLFTINHLICGACHRRLWQAQSSQILPFFAKTDRYAQLHESWTLVLLVIFNYIFFTYREKRAVKGGFITRIGMY